LKIGLSTDSFCRDGKTWADLYDIIRRYHFDLKEGDGRRATARCSTTRSSYI